MRRSFLSFAAAILGSSASMAVAIEHAARMADSRVRINFDRVGPRTYTTGMRYPHSSTQQRARIARQLAAGQLNIARV